VSNVESRSSLVSNGTHSGPEVAAGTLKSDPCSARSRKKPSRMDESDALRAGTSAEVDVLKGVRTVGSCYPNVPPVPNHVGSSSLR
jgi:hypothetical protein